MMRILTDFNEMSEDGKKVNVTYEELSANFHVGLRVILYYPNDFEIEAVLDLEKLEDGTEVWYGILDSNTHRDISNSGDNT